LGLAWIADHSRCFGYWRFIIQSASSKGRVTTERKRAQDWRSTEKNELELADQQRKEDSLQRYLDRMQELILDRGLNSNDEIKDGVKLERTGQEWPTCLVDKLATPRRSEIGSHPKNEVRRW
jgi:hypothetical protein